MASCADVLDRREERRDEQVALLGSGVVVSVTVVSPGADKDDAVARSACAAAVEAVRGLVGRRGWRLAAERSASGVTGPEWLAAVDASGMEVKAALVALEESEPLGRLWDLDVVVGPVAGQPVVLSRRDLGLEPRRCLVCDLDAAGCARSRRHSFLLVDAARAGLAAGASREAAEAAGGLAVQALLMEARLTPKPGLVDAVSSGSHSDMDLVLLERSAEALLPWFVACWQTGWALSGADAATLRSRLVDIGLAAEAEMLAATGGVNTHKGALFALGLLLAAWGGEAAGQASEGLVERARTRAARLASGWLEDWRRRPDASHGASALRELGLTGARGEASGGFETAATVGLPAYRSRLAETGDADDAARWALMSLMAANDDTNLVARGGAEGLAYVRGWARGVVEGRPGPDALVADLAGAEAAFVARRLSPGGSADLLAVTWLLDRVDAIGLAAGPGAG